MQPIHIFKAGTHTSAAGTSLDFSEEVLQQAAAAYDPALMEAPIVVGHPKDNGPAFGWISGLNFSEAGLHAEPSQVNDDFAELVEKGSYKKVSASFYSPEASANPVPGTYYLRHVGFLGAMPPSIKGLDAIQFNETEDGDVIEFSAEWETAGMFRRLREFLIEKFGIEDADKAIPGYMVEGVEDAARSPNEITDTALFAENDTGENTMTEQELKDAQAKLDADKTAHEASVTSFNEAQEAEATTKEKTRKAAIGSRVDALVKGGKVLPVAADAIKSFTEKLDTEAVVEFGEGDSQVSESAVDYFLGLLEGSTSGVNFSEASADDGEGHSDEMTAEELGRKAHDYRESEKAAGRTISITEAVAAVSAK